MTTGLEYISQLTLALYGLQQQRTLCDVILTADDGEVLAHSIVLAAASPFICDQFVRLAASSSSRLEYNLKLPGTISSAIMIVVQFLYTGHLTISCSDELQQVALICTNLGIDFTKLTPAVVDATSFLADRKSQTSQNSIQENQAAKQTLTGGIPDTGKSHASSETYVVIETPYASQDLNGHISAGNWLEDITGSMNITEQNLHIATVSDAGRATSQGVHQVCLKKISHSDIRASSSKIPVGQMTNETESVHLSNSAAENLENSIRNVDNVKQSASKHFHKGTRVCRRQGKLFSSGKHLSYDCESHLPYTCDLCGKGYAFRRYLIAHRMAHDGMKPFLCEECGRGFYAKTNLKRHVLLRHENIRPYVCDRCGKGFVAQSRLARHIETHDVSLRSRYNCDTCGTTFANAGNLLRHRRLHTSTPRPHVCAICRHGFTQKSSLQAHMLLHSTEGRQQASCVCPVCGKRLSKLSNLRKHSQLHLPPEERLVHVCDSCGKTFETREYLVRHTSTMHANRQHMCESCHRLFRSQRQLRNHTSRVHERSMCPTCGKEFVGVRALNTHLRIHSSAVVPLM